MKSASPTSTFANENTEQLSFAFKFHCSFSFQMATALAAVQSIATAAVPPHHIRQHVSKSLPLFLVTHENKCVVSKD